MPLALANDLIKAMALFRGLKELAPVKEVRFKLERELQSLTESNLKTLFGLEFVCTEFERNGLRIDTLAFDMENKCFVIIEFKRDQNFSVVDQGLAYLGLMLNHKAEFVLEYNEQTGGTLRRDDIDWSQSRVMFVMRSFSTYQQAATNFKDLPIELWEVIRFDNDSILYNRLQTVGSPVSIKAVSKNTEIEKVAKEVKTFREDDVLPPDEKRRKIYETVRESLFSNDSQLHVHATKAYLAFRRKDNWRNLIVVWFRSGRVRFEMMRTEPKDLKDPESRVGYVKDSMKYFHQHISFIEATSDKEAEYAIYILQQVLNNAV